MAMQAIVPGSFETLPRRVFLDTSILQYFAGYGEFLFENVEPSSDRRIWKMADGMEELDHLRVIFFLNGRSAFEYAISENSLREVAAKGDSSFVRWASEWVHYWNGCLSSYEINPFPGKGQRMVKLLSEAKFDYLSLKDRQLIHDALLYECNGFLTVDFKLRKNWQHLYRNLGLLVMRPSDFWDLLRPWAGLFM